MNNFLYVVMRILQQVNEFGIENVLIKGKLKIILLRFSLKRMK